MIEVYAKLICLNKRGSINCLKDINWKHKNYMQHKT